MSFLFVACHQDTDLPNPQFGIVANPSNLGAGCQFQNFGINFNSGVYSLNGADFVPFDDKITGWISDETVVPSGAEEALVPLVNGP